MNKPRQILIKNLSKDTFVLEFPVRTFFDDSGGVGKNIPYRIGDIGKKFAVGVKTYNIAVSKLTDLTYEELALLLNSLINEIEYNDKIRNNIMGLLRG